MMSEQRSRQPRPTEPPADPLSNNGPPDEGAAPRDAEAAPPPQPAVLRATRAFLLPPAVRAGFEQALAGVCEATRDEGMHELEQHPVMALASAVLADLEDALSAVEELDQLYEGGSSGREEGRGYRVVKAMEEAVRPQLATLRRLRDELEQPEGALTRDRAADEGTGGGEAGP